MEVSSGLEFREEYKTFERENMSNDLLLSSKKLYNLSEKWGGF